MERVRGGERGGERVRREREMHDSAHERDN